MGREWSRKQRVKQKNHIGFTGAAEPTAGKAELEANSHHFEALIDSIEDTDSRDGRDLRPSRGSVLKHARSFPLMPCMPYMARVLGVQGEPEPALQATANITPAAAPGLMLPSDKLSPHAQSSGDFQL